MSEEREFRSIDVFDVQSNIESLNNDCQREIFSKLSLKDLASLRLACRLFDRLVCNYLKLEHNQVQLMLANIETYREKCACYMKDGLLGHSLALPSCFPPEQFAIFKNNNTVSKFEKLTKFLSKFVPSVTKLALLVDDLHKDSDKMLTILNLYPKLECLYLNYNIIKKPDDCELRRFATEIMMSIDTLPSLKALYFFPQSNYPEIFSWYTISFNNSMTKKLSVYDSGIFESWNDEHEHVHENIKELTVSRNQSAKNNIVISKKTFPNISKLVLQVGKYNNSYMARKSLLSWDLLQAASLNTLKVLEWHAMFDLTLEGLWSLNSLKNLTTFACSFIQYNNFPNPLLEDEKIRNSFKNYTIKELVIKNGYDIQRALDGIREYEQFFVALETIKINKPYLEEETDILLEGYASSLKTMYSPCDLHRYTELTFTRQNIPEL